MRRMRRAKNHFNGSFFYHGAEGPPEVEGEETDFPVLLMLPRRRFPPDIGSSSTLILFYFIRFNQHLLNIYCCDDIRS